MKNKIFRLLKNPTIIVIALWLFFQALWYLRFGFVFNFEGTKYTHEASYLLEHHGFSQFRYLFYCTTIIVIACSLMLKTGLLGALLFIMGINLAAYLWFFSVLQNFFGRSLPAVLIAAFLVSFWPYQSWSMFLFTECMFYSLVMVLFGHLLRFERLTFRFLSIACGLLLLLIISRPLGILFVPPVLVFVFVHLNKRQRLYLVFAGIFFCFLLNYIVHIFFTTTSDWSMNYALTGDMLICDMPDPNPNYQPKLSNNPNQLYQLFYYLTHNFSHFLGLAAVRLRYFFFLAKPFYSIGHNLYLIAYDIFIYGGIVWNFKRIRRTMPIAVLLFVFSSILLFALATALQCDEYHGRFALTLTPFYVMLAIIGWQPSLARLFKLLKEKQGQN